MFRVFKPTAEKVDSGRFDRHPPVDSFMRRNNYSKERERERWTVKE